MPSCRSCAVNRNVVFNVDRHGIPILAHDTVAVGDDGYLESSIILEMSEYKHLNGKAMDVESTDMGEFVFVTLLIL